MTDKLTHINERGEAHMVDVGGKPVTQRSATARACITMQPTTISAIKDNTLAKGDVFATARIAGIQAAKKCSELIPLCHPLMLTSIEVDITIDEPNQRVVINSTCKLDGKTGVEMEALTACSVASLTVYDMCKALDKGMIISDIRLVEKTGGKSGTWRLQNG